MGVSSCCTVSLPLAHPRVDHWNKPAVVYNQLLSPGFPFGSTKNVSTWQVAFKEPHGKAYNDLCLRWRKCVKLKCLSDNLYTMESQTWVSEFCLLCDTFTEVYFMVLNRVFLTLIQIALIRCITCGPLSLEYPKLDIFDTYVCMMASSMI